MELTDITATEAIKKMAGGDLTSAELVDACLARIEQAEEIVQAWQYLDPDLAKSQALEMDELRQSGLPVGPLHGVPVGVKDIIDTEDMPTECGSPLLAGNAPETDAVLVSQLKEAGAVIMGKTVTTEFAVFQPGKTTNPHNAAHTPGGSSSGSAAAVATGMVPVAVGTQTNGSIIRPASFCGVYGFKPSRGVISRTGVLTQSRPLDTIGVFARTIQDLALIAGCVNGYDPEDGAMKQRGSRDLVSLASEEPPVPPMLAFVKTPFWDKASEDTQSGFAEITDLLGENCDDVILPSVFEDAARWHRTIMVADLAKNFAGHYDRDKSKLSDVLREMIEEGQQVLAVNYNAAMDWIDVLYAGLAEVFERYDAIITPAAPGEAPTIETTGDPIFSTIWTLLGVPAISLPLLQGEKGLPIGVQLVGPRIDDARLLRTANWLAAQVAEND